MSNTAALTRWLESLGLESVLDQLSELDIELIAGDASPRRYYRWVLTAEACFEVMNLLNIHAQSTPVPKPPAALTSSSSTAGHNELAGPPGPASLILVDSPPTEKNPEFLAIRALLEQAGVRVPALYHADLNRGFMLLEDLGNDTLLPLLSEFSVSVWYPKALNMLAEIARIALFVPSATAPGVNQKTSMRPELSGRLERSSLHGAADRLRQGSTANDSVSAMDDPAGRAQWQASSEESDASELPAVNEFLLPAYDAPLLQQELNLFPEWFVTRLLGLNAPELPRLFADLSGFLIANAVEQPQVLVHRDFHSRNLMVLNNSELATIDFQDAVIGPITYDPVSLLKDCYVRWPRARQLAWLADHQANLELRGVLKPVSSAAFIRWFDLMGLQRHLKVLGIFARLYLRDAKPGYLNDLPLVLAYTREALAIYAGDDARIADFRDWLEAEVVPVCRDQPWFSDAHDHWLELISLVRQP